MRCRLAPVRGAAAALAASVVTYERRLRVRCCGLIGCGALIAIGDGAADTNRCLAHVGMANEPESDEKRVARVCNEMGWQRARGRR